MPEGLEKYQESMKDALKNIRVADHIIYITYPVIKDKRLLLKSLDAIYDSIVNIINAVLQYEYIWKRVQIYSNPKENFETFINKSARRYNLSPEDISGIETLFTLVESYRKSAMEFMRKEKIIIMSPGLSTTTLDAEKVKRYLSLARRIFEKTRFLL
jgi:hypothetical protein